MRAFIFLALLAPIMAIEVNFHHQGVLTHLQEKQARLFEKEIEAFLECLRDIILNGDAESGLPILDPLKLEELHVDLDKLNLQGISGKVDLTNFLLNGVAGWDLSKLKISITIIPIGAKLEVIVSWPAGDVSGSYNADVSLFDHKIVGSGNVDGNLNKLKIEVTGQGVLNRISIKSAKVKVSLSSAKLVIENLSVDGNDVSGLISEIAAGAPAFLNENEKAINDFINNSVIPIINQIIGSILNPSVRSDIPIIGKCIPARRV